MEGSKTLSSHYVVSVVVQFEVSAISLRAVTAIIVPISWSVINDLLFFHVNVTEINVF